MREVGAAELRHIARGAAILGAGGGGDTYVHRLVAQRAIEEHGPVLLVEPHEVPDDALVVGIGHIGAPTVMAEKLPGGGEAVAALLTLQQEVGRPVTHVLPIEIGGLNSVAPFPLAAERRLPVIDADCMGRAFPMVHMVVCTIDGIVARPLAIADEKGNSIVLDVRDNHWAERLARSATVGMGCAAMLCSFPMSGRQARESTIAGSITAAQRLGERDRDVDAVAAFLGGSVVFRGRVVDVWRTGDTGFVRGEAWLEGSSGSCRLAFQNEYLVASREGEVVASVPDLICVLDNDGRPVAADRLHYGDRVAVVGAPCHPRWRTPQGLALVGPGAFGYDHDYVPVAG